MFIMAKKTIIRILNRKKWTYNCQSNIVDFTNNQLYTNPNEY